MTDKPYRKFPPDAPRWTAPAKLIVLVLAVYLADWLLRHI